MEINSIHTQILVHLRVNKTNFHIKDYALGLALKQRRKATRKSPIHFIFVNSRYIQRFHFVSALEFFVIFFLCGFPANRKQSVLMNIDFPLDSSREHLSSLFDFSTSLFSPSSPLRFFAFLFVSVSLQSLSTSCTHMNSYFRYHRFFLSVFFICYLPLPDSIWLPIYVLSLSLSFSFSPHGLTIFPRFLFLSLSLSLTLSCFSR